MYWMVEDSFVVSPGYMAVHTRMSVHSTLRRKCGNAIVIFDGYEGISTKDMTHQRRAKGRIGPTVTFTEDMAVTVQKEQFWPTVATNKIL